MKDVIIKITGRQGLDGESDVIELATEGKLMEAEGKITLIYSESEPQGMEKTVTELAAEKDQVVLKREGGISSEMVIRKGQRNNCFYVVPQGELVLGIYGEKIENNLTANGGTLKMIYTIDANGRTVSKNQVDIKVEEVKICQ